MPLAIEVAVRLIAHAIDVRRRHPLDLPLRALGHAGRHPSPDEGVVLGPPDDHHVDLVGEPVPVRAALDRKLIRLVNDIGPDVMDPGLGGQVDEPSVHREEVRLEDLLLAIPAGDDLAVLLDRIQREAHVRDVAKRGGESFGHDLAEVVVRHHEIAREGELAVPHQRELLFRHHGIEDRLRDHQVVRHLIQREELRPRRRLRLLCGLSLLRLRHHNIPRALSSRVAASTVYSSKSCFSIHSR